ncbi:MAG: hypothetical protein Q4E42_05440 [Phascolarctobacterium sp.]|nr:hypothetical protein [Phascolarctobacterium sp.]
MGKYDDIINLPHHVSKNRPHLSMEQRAAQFASFRALTGYFEMTNEVERYVEERFYLTDEEIDNLNEKFREISEHLDEMPKVEITYFVPDKYKEGGKYITETEKIRVIDIVNGFVETETGKRYWINKIKDVSF